MTRPPLPPFTLETAIQKVPLAEDVWNSRDLPRVALAYSPDSRWRNRAIFLQGRGEIEAFLTQKWFRSHGNENRAFDGEGLTHTRIASINDLAIAEGERQFRWPSGRCPDAHARLTERGL